MSFKVKKIDIQKHFEFRVAVVHPDYDMVVCKSDGTYFNKNRKNTLINKNSDVFAERPGFNEKGTEIKIFPMTIEETKVYVKHFNKVRKSKGWKPLEFTILSENG